jgi:hypothetical protein
MIATVIVLSNDGHYASGESITGMALWEGGQPQSLQVRLFWFTQGKGTQDVQVVQVEKLTPLGENGSLPFAFVAPLRPYSFAGKLISLTWGLELVGKPEGFTRQEIVIAPQRAEINLCAE